MRFALSVWAILLTGAPASGQELSAFPETPRPVRRIDSAAPVSLTESPAPAIFSTEAAKTPIRRLGDPSDHDAARSGSQWTVWVILVGIVGAAAGISYWSRRSGGGNAHWRIPTTVFQVLGRSAVSPNQSVTLMRLGERVLLVSSSGATMQTLAVVTDPVEVATITAECLSKRPVQLLDPRTRSPRRPETPAADTPAVAGTITADRTARPVRRTSPEVGHA